MPLDHVDHINIVVDDLESNVRFYTELLGFTETMRARLEGEWIASIVGLENAVAECVYVQPPNGPRIELLKYLTPEGEPIATQGAANTHGIRHLAFRVDDIEAEYSRLSAAGVEFIGPPVAVPLKAVTHATGRKQLCYFHGPENVLLELCQYS